jgi:hypothetical protein
MGTNVILSTMGVAALMVSSAMAQSPRAPMPTNSTVPTDGHGSVAPYVANEGGPYAPSLPDAQPGRGPRYPAIWDGIDY